MPIYNYKGYDASTGATRKGKIEADTPKAARQRLRKVEKVIVSDIKVEASLEKVQSKGGLFAGRVKEVDVSVMTRQFATLQKAHVPLDESLKALTAQVENVVLRNTLSAVKERVSEGQSLADASAQYPGVFNRLYINMVRAGESSGTLGLVLDRLADYMEKQVEARSQIISAMTYPLVMMSANALLIGYLFVSLVPKLQKVFDNLNVTLPWYTKLLIASSEWFVNNWMLIPFMIAGAYFGFKYWINSDQGRRQFDKGVLRTPIFGELVLRIQTARFTQTLSTLLASGVPIIRALDITKNIITNSVISNVLEDAKIAVQEGRSLGQAIDKSKRFPPLVTHMILTGERTGQLEEMLTHVAEAYDAEVSRKIDSLISLVEPLMIIFMAGGAGAIIAALMVPMLGIMKQIR